MLEPSKIKLIHHAIRNLGMTDEDYRIMLRRIGGVESSKALDEAGFDAVMMELKRLGFTSSHRVIAFGGERPGMASDRQLDMVRSLWRQYIGKDDEEGLRQFVEKRFTLSSLRFMDKRAASKIISTLLRMVEWRKTHPRASRKRQAAQTLTRSVNRELDIPPF